MLQAQDRNAGYDTSTYNTVDSNLVSQAIDKNPEYGDYEKAENRDPNSNSLDEYDYMGN